MAEVGESSSAKPSNEIWAKLVPSDATYSDVEISADEIVICSQIRSATAEKLEWCTITRNSDLCSATMLNKGSIPILADEAIIQKEDTVVIKCGSEVIPGPTKEGYLSYRFIMNSGFGTSQKQLKICIDVEHAKCSICLSIWHDVVTVAPCLHNFCNGCFSEWLRRSEERHSSVLCPQCRAIVHSAGRNHFLHNISQDIIQADSSLKRSSEEVALLDKYASIQSSLVINDGKKVGRRKRASSPVDSSYSVELPCPQCGTQLGNFRCNQNMVHLQCHACGGMMPSRATHGVPQHCLGCDRAFCGAYWDSLGFTESTSYSICSPETFKPIQERTISRIPSLLHERNRHEQDITEKCIRHMGRTLQDVIAEWISKLQNREIDRTRMPLNHAEMITAQTHVCNECYDKLTSFLLYWFRISLPRHLLPPDAINRDDCWYGYRCRTQHHNEEHASKRNHVCHPTRGNNF